MRARLDVLAAVLALAACNGGKGSPSPTPTLVLAQPSLEIRQGSPASLAVSVTGGSGSTAVTVSGLPAGVTVDPLAIASTETAGTLVFHASAASAHQDRLPVTVESNIGGQPLSAGLALTVAGVPGSLDTTFGGGGVVVYGTSLQLVLRGGALQADGKIVVSGGAAPSGASYPAVMRFQANGAIDGTFGVGGLYQASGATFRTGIAGDVAIQPDGRILVVAESGPAAAPQSQFTLLRLNGSGTLDSSFGTAGVVFDDFGAAFGTPNDSSVSRALALFSDGTILAVGNHDLVSGTFTSPAALARFNPDGTLDATFGSGGRVQDSRAWSWLSVALDGAENPVSAGTPAGGPFAFAIGRYLPDGTADGSFNATGLVTGTAGMSSPLTSVAVQADRRPVAAGIEVNEGLPSYMVMMRATTSGSLDAGFATSGVSAGPPANGASVATTPQWIYLAGGAPPGMLLLRYDLTGQLDPAFATLGVATVNFPGFVAVGEVLIQPDGRVIVVGYTSDGGNSYAVLLRFWD